MSFGLGKLQLSQSIVGSSVIDPRTIAQGFKPGSSASLFNITTGGAAVETVTVDALGRAIFGTVKAVGQRYEIEGIVRVFVDDQVSQS